MDLRLWTMRKEKVNQMVVVFHGDESRGIPIRKTNILVKVWKQLEGPRQGGFDSAEAIFFPLKNMAVSKHGQGPL